MPDTPWAETDALFQRALDLPSAERVAFAESVTEGDPDLRSRLLALLAAAAEVSDVFSPSVAAVAADAVSGVPASIGDYRLVRRIGEGGTGEVFLAERDLGGAVQRVALKRLRPGLTGRADPAANARFDQERRVLASLEHPNVARLLDGGKTPDGASFLVMEFVDGEPITDYCARRNLSRDARLGLVVEVARAVEAAHRRLVVHRDLKPHNILVTEDETGAPVPKLLDFGIAKLIHPGGPGVLNDGVLTRTGLQPLTPQYAAPEQIADGEITTATDVYGLGVVLYELLTGERPFGHLTGADLDRAVRTRVPARPSSQSGNRPLALPQSALRGDLDTICLKALRTDPSRRYPTAEAFADDIDRFLTERPIEARTATLGYRSTLFVRRNRGAVLAASAVAAAVLVGLGTTLWQAREASAERDRATEEAVRSKQSAEFLAGLLELGEPYEGAADVPAKALPDSGLARIVRSEEMDPVLKASLLETISGVYQAQGRYEEAEHAAAQSVRVLRDHGGSPQQLGASLATRSKMLMILGRDAAAEPMAREAYQRLRAFPDANVETLDAAYSLANILLGLDRNEESLEVIVQEIDRVRRPDPDIELQRALLNLEQVEAYALMALGRDQEAARASREVLAIAGEVLQEGTINRQAIEFNMSAVLAETGYVDEAEPILKAIYALEVETLGLDHLDVANTETVLADIALRRGRPREAAARAARAERVFVRVLGVSHPNTALAQLYSALAAFRLGDAERASARLREMLRAETDADTRPTVTLALATIAASRGQADAAQLRQAEAAVPADERVRLKEQMGLVPDRPER